MASSVQVLLPSFGYTYTFTGMLSVKHEYSLKLQTDSSSASGKAYINGARNQPDKVILSVMETDIGHQAVPCYYAVCDSLPKAELWTNQQPVHCCKALPKQEWVTAIASKRKVNTAEIGIRGWGDSGPSFFVYRLKSTRSGHIQGKDGCSILILRGYVHAGIPARKECDQFVRSGRKA